MSKYKVSLVFRGEIIENLNYGPCARAWWVACPNDNNATYTPLYPLCLGIKTITTINSRDFMITIIQNNLKPGFLCHSESLQSKICKSSSKAITSIYQLAFSTKTKLDGLLVMGFDNLEICNLLLSDLYFRPFSFKIPNLNLIIFEIEFTNNKVIVKIYQNSQEKYTFHGANPNVVLNEIGILAQFTGSTLFGLEHEQTKLSIEKEQTSHCTVEDWQNRELRAWKALLRHTGCSNITPFGKKSKFEFWTRSKDPTKDEAMLKYLYECKFLQSVPANHNKTDQFWSAFQDALDSNIRGNDGKRRILSIIADRFHYDTIKEKLSVSNDLITEARHYARINGPGCVQLEKPKITIKKLTREKEEQIESFFQDKANVIMSSYKTDSATGLPENDIYKEDLGGLCSICNMYGYESFDELQKLILHYASLDHQLNNDKERLLTECNNLQRYLKKDYENELKVDSCGYTKHNTCINHSQIQEHIPSDLHNKLSVLKEYLLYYLAHQTRKVYLNAQLNAQLGELNEMGALIIVDYKMKILPKSARETNKTSLEKRMALHSILIYTSLYNNTTLQVRAFDHWSTDTRQDAWFTASSLNAAISEIDPQPEWVVFISDNGPHYYKADLMLIMGRWKEWYNIYVRKWTFLEAEEAKTTIDSHHAQISHAINRHVCLGFNIAQGSDIELAIEGICGTSVAHLEPERPKGKKQVNTLPARAIPNIGEWNEFTPAKLEKLQKKDIQKPNPQVSQHSVPKSPWFVPMPHKSSWALKENQKFGKRGGGKRISKHVITYLEGYFLAGNINKSDRYTAEEMHTELLELVKTGNLEESDVPKVSTIQNWIGRYATQHKQKIALVSQCSIFQ
ncbi:hypothetical protein C2G38_2247120 [Gigaspora rosea]|uniref:Uncharacterized protein n=1 Tax=Gigaspora rosea TaxID=44941 RepID=A0A397V196_9GLOM|nr:hypothetical protein C2G38_2247120 [Gigaspora rosea]